MTKIPYSTTDAPSPVGSYSQGIEANGFFYTAGFGPHNPVTGKYADNIAEQTRQTLQNIAAVLKTRGLTLDHVVKTTVHLADLAGFTDFNDAYGEFFTAPFPVRTTVGSQLANFLVEIDVVAAIPHQ